MTIERIYRQIGDRSSWPPPPERQRWPASAADQRPAVLVSVPIESLVPWVPAPLEDENE